MMRNKGMKRKFEDFINAHVSSRKRKPNALADFLQSTNGAVSSSSIAADHLLDLSEINDSLTAESLVASLIHSSSLSSLKLHDVAAKLLAQKCKPAFSISSLMTSKERQILNGFSMVLKKLIDTESFSKAAFLKAFSSQCTLHIEVVHMLCQFFSLKSISLCCLSETGLMKKLTTQLILCCQPSEDADLDCRRCIVQDLMLEMAELSFGNKDDSADSEAKKIFRLFLSNICKKFMDAESTDVNVYHGLLSSSGTFPGLFAQHFSIILSHKAVIKMREAVQKHHQWTFNETPQYLLDTFTNFMVALKPSGVFDKIQKLLESQEINWRYLLCCISTALVVEDESAKLFKDLVNNFLSTAFRDNSTEHLLTAILLARHGCLEGPHIATSYGLWFKAKFSCLSSEKSFKMLIDQLTDLVPYESAAHLRAHRDHPLTPPVKLTHILSDYYNLIRTRLQDFEALETNADARDKKSEEDVEQAMKYFALTGKLNERVLFLSKFAIGQFNDKFIPELLRPRILPDVPDTRMKLIDCIVKSTKIHPPVVSKYKEMCENLAEQALEESASDLILEETILKFKRAVEESKDVMKNLSLVRCSIQSNPSFSTEDVHLVLNTMCELCHQSPLSMDWLSKLMKIICEHQDMSRLFLEHLKELLSHQLGSLNGVHIRGLAAIIVHIHAIDSVSIMKVLTYTEKHFTHRMNTALQLCYAIVMYAARHQLSSPKRAEVLFQYFHLRKHRLSTPPSLPIVIRSLLKSSKITVADWIRIESIVDAENDLLSLDQRNDFNDWILWNYFLPQSNVESVTMEMINVILDLQDDGGLNASSFILQLQDLLYNESIPLLKIFKQRLRENKLERNEALNWFRLCRKLHPHLFFCDLSKDLNTLRLHIINSHLKEEYFFASSFLGLNIVHYFLQGMNSASEFEPALLDDSPSLSASIWSMWPQIASSKPALKESLCSKFDYFKQIDSFNQQISRLVNRSGSSLILGKNSELAPSAAILAFSHFKSQALDRRFLMMLEEMECENAFQSFTWNLQLCCIIQACCCLQEGKQPVAELEFLGSLWCNLEAIHPWYDDHSEASLMDAVPAAKHRALSAVCIRALMITVKKSRSVLRIGRILKPMLMWHVQVTMVNGEADFNLLQILSPSDMDSFSQTLCEVIETSPKSSLIGLDMNEIEKADPMVYFTCLNRLKEV